MQIGPEHQAGDRGARMQHVMVVVPVDSDINETQHVTEKDRQNRSSTCTVSPCGTFNSSTMIAITPSLNASNLPLSMLSVSLPVGCSSHADRFAAGSRASDGISNSKMQARLAID